jgi:hypothetical protein
MAAFDPKDRIGRRKLNELPIVAKMWISAEPPLSAEISVDIGVLKEPFIDLDLMGTYSCPFACRESGTFNESELDAPLTSPAEMRTWEVGKRVPRRLQHPCKGTVPKCRTWAWLNAHMGEGTKTCGRRFWDGLGQSRAACSQHASISRETAQSQAGTMGIQVSEVNGRRQS